MEKRKYIRDIPTKDRVKVREGFAKLRTNLKKQNDMFAELYILPNKIYDKKIEEFLRGRISWQELSITERKQESGNMKYEDIKAEDFKDEVRTL